MLKQYKSCFERPEWNRTLKQVVRQFDMQGSFIYYHQFSEQIEYVTQLIML